MELADLDALLSEEGMQRGGEASALSYSSLGLDR